MTTAAALRQALRERIAPLMEELRASTPTHDHDQRRTVAKQVEADSDALVEATAVDLELMLAELVPVEFHAVTLADPELIKWFPWESRKTDAGKLLRAWAGGAHPSRPLPEGVTPEEVATWMLPALKRHNHSLADDGPEDIPVEQWEAWSAERQRGITELRARMTPGQPLEEWGALNAEEDEVERAYEARVVEWENKANNSLVKVARGFTYPNGTKVPPSLRAPVFKYPATGEPWTWWPEAMVTLYLANPVTVAARCMRALERLDTRKTEETHLATARTALEELKVDAENMGRLAGDLADELRKRVRDARALLNVDAVLESIRTTAGHALLPWDETAAAFYEQLSTSAEARGGKTAEKLRANARTRWSNGQDLFRLWTPQQPHGVPRFALNLARLLWQDVVAPRTQREHQKPAALVRAVHIKVVDLLRPGSTFKDNHLMDKDGRQLMLLTRMSALDDVPAMEMEAIPKLLKRGVQLFGSIQAHRTVRHFVTEGHRRVLAGEADARRLQYDGGWARMAEDAGISESEEARAIVLALAHVPFVGPNSEQGNLLSYTWRPHAPGRKALVSVVLGDMLLPGFVHAMTGKTRSSVEARQLVPVVDLPGFVGRKNEHGAQATLQMLVLAEMRRRAVELATTGSVRFTDTMWRELVEQAALPPATLQRVLDRWTQNGNDTPAFLVRVGRDGWTLAVPAYSAALDYLVAAGRDSQQASVAGKASRRGGWRRRGKTSKITGA